MYNILHLHFLLSLILIHDVLKINFMHVHHGTPARKIPRQGWFIWCLLSGSICKIIEATPAYAKVDIKGRTLDAEEP